MIYLYFLGVPHECQVKTRLRFSVQKKSKAQKRVLVSVQQVGLRGLVLCQEYSKCRNILSGQKYKGSKIKRLKNEGNVSIKSGINISKDFLSPKFWKKAYQGNATQGCGRRLHGRHNWSTGEHHWCLTGLPTALNTRTCRARRSTEWLSTGSLEGEECVWIEGRHILW